MMRVYKFPTPIADLDDYIDVSMPRHAQILRVDIQGDALCIWALVDPESLLCTRRFRVAGTGHPITETENGLLTFRGTFYLGYLVFHVFEVTP